MKAKKTLLSAGVTASLLSVLMLFSGVESLAAGKKRSAAPAKAAVETLPSETDDMQPSDESLPIRLVADPSTMKAKDEGGVESIGQDPMAPGAIVPVAMTDGASPAEADAQAVPPMPALDVNKAAENEIPVLANTKEAKKAAGGDYGRLLVTLGVLTVVLGGASFGLKRWSAKKGTRHQNTRIKVMTQHYLGPKKSLAIVQVAGESLLIGITDQNISMLKTLSLIDDEVPESVPQNFDRALEDYEELDQAEPSSRSAKGKNMREDEDFTISGISEIRDVVSKRLKNMRNL